jgi:hypothetical protein
MTTAETRQRQRRHRRSRLPAGYPGKNMDDQSMRRQRPDAESADLFRQAQPEANGSKALRFGLPNNQMT